MSNLRVFDPFAIDSFDDLFRGVMKPGRFDAALPASQIKVDIDEADNAFNVKAELPGVKKDDIHVEIDRNLVSIRGEVKNEKDVKKDGRVLRSERYYGSVSRAFTLGTDIDEANVKAKFDNGVLELTLPKRVSAASKRITVQ